MLAKINLKTACGCTRILYESVHETRYKYDVPIKSTMCLWATLIKSTDLLPPETTALTRTFSLVRRKSVSTVRVELWYEEAVYG